MLSVPPSVLHLGRVRRQRDLLITDHPTTEADNPVESVPAAEADKPLTRPPELSQFDHPRKVNRPVLVKFCLDAILVRGPMTTEEMLTLAMGPLAPDDVRYLKSRLPKWLVVAGRTFEPPLTMRRTRNPADTEGPRLHKWWFWDPPIKGRPSAADLSMVMTALHEIRQELTAIKAVQAQMLNRQHTIVEGIASTLEKVTWNGEL